jgi:transcriptional regulator with XRE-family HTH domain
MRQLTELGVWLTAYRKAKKPKVSQAHVANQAELARQYYGGVETGRFIPSRESLVRIALALEMDPPDTAKTLTLAGYVPRPSLPVILDLNSGVGYNGDGTKVQLSAEEMERHRGDLISSILPKDAPLSDINQRLVRIEGLLMRLLATVESVTARGLKQDGGQGD